MSDIQLGGNNRKQKQYHEFENAKKFYQEKLENYPTFARYTHYMAALNSEQGNMKEAESYYRQTLCNAPGDVMVKNDFAVHLLNNYTDRKEDAVKELKKALIAVNDNALLHKNTSAALAKKGDFRDALTHAQQAKFISPLDPMNHRNIARLEATLGDSHTSLKHNMTSIELEEAQRKFNPHFTPNTSAYRAAAVQIISKGGKTQEALELMNKARKYEGKSFQLTTSQRTHEIINKLKARQSEEFRQVEEKKRLEEEKKQKSKEEWESMLQEMTK
jgi:tetratricopeptide (TPR) repeat protein